MKRPSPPDGGLKEPVKSFADTYSAEEIVLLRLQLARGNDLARKAAKTRGVKLHPRIAGRQT